MGTTTSVLLACAATAASLATGCDQRPHVDPAADVHAPAGTEQASAPAPAGPVRALVGAQPFTLERAATHWWRAERPSYDAGWLVVLAVDPAYAEPRALETPVLYAGAEVVERVNFGAESGRVVCVVPSARAADGGPVLDLGTVAFFYGAADLPERVDAREAQHQLESAVRRGARPFSADEIARARAAGGTMHLGSREELDELAALLVLDHAPEDQDLGTGMLVPRVR